LANPGENMKHKLGILMLTLLALALAGPASAQGPELRLATEAGYPPFSMLGGDGKLAGFDVEIGNALCTELKLRCVWVKQEWEGMIPALLARKYDAIVASMSITEERKAKIAFTGKYYASPLALVARKNHRLAQDMGALKGKKIGVARGTVSDFFASRRWAGKGVEVVRYGKQDEAQVDLAAGRVDAVLTDYWQAWSELLGPKLGGEHALVGPKITGVTPEERAIIGEGIGIGLRKSDQDLRRQLDGGIARIRANGVYQAISKKYFGEDIFGP
jgi:lysine-arginine-ornithine-binding protein